MKKFYNKTLGLCGCVLSACLQHISHAQDLPAKLPDAPAAPQIRVLVMADNQATLSSQMEGRIDKVLVANGDSFSAGQTLLVFDCQEQRALQRQHQAELQSAQKNFETQQQLLAMKAASDLELAKSRAERDQAQALLDMAGIKLQYCELKAPFAGRVITRDINAHENVRYGEPLLHIVDNTRLQLKAYAPSQWLKHLVLGQKLRVNIDETGKQYAGEITMLGAQVDANSQTVELRARIVDAHSDLLAGMSGTAHWSGDSP